MAIKLALFGKLADKFDPDLRGEQESQIALADLVVVKNISPFHDGVDLHLLILSSQLEAGPIDRRVAKRNIYIASFIIHLLRENTIK